MRSNRFVDLGNARKSVTESVTKIDRNDLISVSLELRKGFFFCGEVTVYAADEKV